MTMTLEQVLDLLDSALAGQTGSRVTIHATRAKKARDAIAAHLSSSKATAVDSRRIDWLESECTQAPDEYGMARQLYFGTYSSGQTLRDAIDAHLLSQEAELADYKNASLHAADDCSAKDAEIERLQSGIAKHVNRICELQDRLAAADALLREVYDHGENMALHEKIAAHLSENTHDRA